MSNNDTNFLHSGTRYMTDLTGERMCKGAWELGTACGKCSRCIATKPQEFDPLTTQMYLNDKIVQYIDSGISHEPIQSSGVNMIVKNDSDIFEDNLVQRLKYLSDRSLHMTIEPLRSAAGEAAARIEVLEVENEKLRKTWLEDCARFSAERSEASTRISMLDQALNVAQDGFRQLYRSGTTWSGQSLCREHFNKINAVIWK